MDHGFAGFIEMESLFEEMPGTWAHSTAGSEEDTA
jgi:hypothetical protein